MFLFSFICWIAWCIALENYSLFFCSLIWRAVSACRRACSRSAAPAGDKQYNAQPLPTQTIPDISIRMNMLDIYGIDLMDGMWFDCCFIFLYLLQIRPNQFHVDAPTLVCQTLRRICRILRESTDNFRVCIREMLKEKKPIVIIPLMAKIWLKAKSVHFLCWTIHKIDKIEVSMFQITPKTPTDSCNIEQMVKISHKKLMNFTITLVSIHAIPNTIRAQKSGNLSNNDHFKSSSEFRKYWFLGQFLNHHRKGYKCNWQNYSIITSLCVMFAVNRYFWIFRTAKARSIKYVTI